MSIAQELPTDRLTVVQLNGVPDWRTLSRFEMSLRRTLAERGCDLRFAETEVGGATVMSENGAAYGCPSRAGADGLKDARPCATVLATPDFRLASILRDFATVAFWIESAETSSGSRDPSYGTRLVACDRRERPTGRWRPAGTWAW